MMKHVAKPLLVTALVTQKVSSAGPPYSVRFLSTLVFADPGVGTAKPILNERCAALPEPEVRKTIWSACN